MADFDDSSSSSVPLQSIEDLLGGMIASNTNASLLHRSRLFSEHFPQLLALEGSSLLLSPFVFLVLLHALVFFLEIHRH